MSSYLIYFLLLLTPAVIARTVPRYADLEEDDQQLFRAAYDTPAYDQEYEEDDLQPGKLDLVKDGLWALKAKIKELKAFDKAFAANLLSTKLKVKDLLKNHLLTLKKHHHEEKPPNHYAPSYQAPHHYETPQYAPQYVHEPQYAAPYAPQYAAPAPQYAAPAPQYAAPAQEYTAHDPYYGL